MNQKTVLYIGRKTADLSEDRGVDMRVGSEWILGRLWGGDGVDSVGLG
jgi:hypothetical protein